MKIKINNVTVDVRVVTTNVCPAGTAYYRVEYCIDGLCIHAAKVGPMYGTPNVIDMLDGKHTWTEPHYQDIPNPDPQPENRKICAGWSGGRPAWWEEKSKTHRQAILDALDQIVLDEVSNG